MFPDGLGSEKSFPEPNFRVKMSIALQKTLHNLCTIWVFQHPPGSLRLSKAPDSHLLTLSRTTSLMQFIFLGMYPISDLWSQHELSWSYKCWILSVFLYCYNYEIDFLYLSSFRKPGNMIIGIGSLKLAVLCPFFSLGCLQAVTPCLGLIITALMKKQTEQPIIRFICPLGFTNIAVSQTAALSFWLPCFMVSLTEWSHTVIAARCGVSSMRSPWKLQSCAGGWSACPRNCREENSIGSEISSQTLARL